MEDNMSWLPHSNNCLCILKQLLNHICVTEALNRPQKTLNMVLYHGKFSQPYSQYAVWMRAYVRSRLSLVTVISRGYPVLLWHWPGISGPHRCPWAPRWRPGFPWRERRGSPRRLRECRAPLQKYRPCPVSWGENLNMNMSSVNTPISLKQSTAEP